jgi:hypothetical protein
MDKPKISPECCEEFVATSTPKRPPNPPRQGQQFSEVQRCPTCGKSITISFETALMLGSDAPEYSPISSTIGR